MKAKFYINSNPHFPKMPSFSFIDEAEKKKYWMLGELIFCETDYLLCKVIPSLNEIMKGGFVQDPTRRDGHLIDYYPFGYDATIIDFYKEISIVNYNYFEDKIEVPSQEIYQFMTEWGKYLREWKDRIESPVR